MSRTVVVTAEHEYEVVIGCNWRQEVASSLSHYGRVVVVMAKSLRQRIEPLPNLTAQVHIVEIPEGENGKSAIVLQSLWDSFGVFGLTRGDAILAIGGGATTDISGFAAATWLRGIDWIAVPTTVAGMVDAAIGGKTGMNSALGKNLIGAFHSPRKVIIDLEWIDSLSDRDFSAGLAEVVKCGFISDSYILDLMDGKSVSHIRSDREIVEELIFRAVTIKAKVVGEDFRESSIREILNYGHTMGHAIELHSEYALRHGEAVSIGMVFVAELAQNAGLISSNYVVRHRRVLEGLGLPISYISSALPELLPLLYRDKKARGRTLRFIVVDESGEVERLEGVTEGEIAAAYGKVAS